MFGELGVEKLKFIMAAQTVNYDTFNQEFIGAVPTISGYSMAAVGLLATSLLW